MPRRRSARACGEGKTRQLNFGYETYNESGRATTHDFPASYDGDVDATYKWADYRVYHCYYTKVKSYTDLRHPYAKHTYTGDLLAGIPKSMDDTLETWKSAHNAGRGVDFGANNHIYYHADSSHKYTWEASALGLTVGAKTAWHASSQVKYGTGSRLRHRYWGNDDDPLYASITYTDGS